MEADDRSTIDREVKGTLSWLDVHMEASQDEFEKRMQAVEKICNPLITKAFGKSSAAASN
jgi:hypothetical protein